MYKLYKYARKQRRNAKQRVLAAQTSSSLPDLSSNGAIPLNSSHPSQTPIKKQEKLCQHRQSYTPNTSSTEAHSQSERQRVSSEEGKASSSPDASDSCLQCEADKRRRRIYRWKLIGGLMLPYFLASVDTTIVATALTTIASHFNKLNQLNWIVTAYTLTSTSFIPAFGQISDVFGRHTALQLSMFCMLIGSVLCAAAQAWGMLLLGRALQGLGAAGIMNLIKIVLSDNVNLEDNAKNNTIFGLIAGISYSIGPVIGGYLTATNWRYCFVLSIGVAFFAHFAIFFLLRKELKRGTYHLSGPHGNTFFRGIKTVDAGGTLLFIFGAGLIILGTTWGGSTYSWDSAAVLVPIIIGTILFISFFSYEYFLEPGRYLSLKFPHQVAMIPWSLFHKKDAFLLTIINAATGAALYSAFYFIGIYWTLVENYSASQAGVQLLYYIPGIGVGVYSAMFLCNILPRQTFYPLFMGSVIECIGISVLTWAVTTRRQSYVDGMMALAGAGTGLRFMPSTLHAAGIWPTRISSVMSLMDFSLPFGGTLAIAIMGAVFNNNMAEAYSAIASSLNFRTFSLQNTQSLKGIDTLPLDIQKMVREKAARAVMWSFVSILPLMALSVLAACVLGNVWIRPKKNQTPTRANGAVMYSSFLLAVLTGSIKRRRQSLDIEPEEQEAEEKNDREGCERE
ncbi:MAG: hypothetical protein M1834_003815 [Cirrosporium novae-zelandiae]|nr:MAG: hypothetical protein M1834_003815 [Cirrosporium novae-zelandiae]